MYFHFRHLEFEPSGSEVTPNPNGVPRQRTIFFALNGQNNLWGCFHKRKRMFCRIKASGDWCTTHVWAEEWMKPKTFFSRTTWSMGSSVQGVFRSCGVSELTKWVYLNCYLPLCDLHGRNGMAPSCVWEV